MKLTITAGHGGNDPGAGGMVVEVFFLSNALELDKYLARLPRVADAIVFAATAP